MEFSMDARVTRLETQMEYVRTDLSDIKHTLASLAAMTERLAAKTENLETRLAAQTDNLEIRLTAQIKELPSKADLRSWNLQLLVAGLTILLLIVGGIIGGLDWIKGH